ncbi:MAG: glycosyltransferase [bacterium]
MPDDLPLVVQVSRFDKYKDPLGVIEAFKKVRKNVDCTLVLLGNVATDDPEGEEVYQSLLEHQEDRIIILSKQDTALVNALQCKAAVVVQKSIKEGFRLTVTEAMWKRAAVVGGKVGGIKHQIEDGENAFLVESIDEAAEKIELLVKNPDLREKIGKTARETVKKKYLMSRLLENYIDMIKAFRIRFELSGYSGKVY